MSTAPAAARGGRLDKAFSYDGHTIVSRLNELYGIAADPDGGVTIDTFGPGQGIYRLRSDGRPDSRFGMKGWARIPATLDQAGDLAVDGAGRVLLSGFWYRSGAPEQIYHALVRLDRNGRVDPTFAGGNGVRVDGNWHAARPVTAHGEVGWAYSDNQMLNFLRIAGNGTILATRSVPLPCAYVFPVSLLGPPSGLRVVGTCVPYPDMIGITHPEAFRGVLASSAIDATVLGMFGPSTSAGTGAIVFQFTYTGAAWLKRQLLRLTPSGRVVWRVDLERRVAGVAPPLNVQSLVPDGRGGAYASLTPASATGRPNVAYVMHIDPRGRIDTSFGRRGAFSVRSPHCISRDTRLAVTKTRIYLAYEDQLCYYDDRHTWGHPVIHLVALTRR